jgi:hypothetical protein
MRMFYAYIVNTDIESYPIHQVVESPNRQFPAKGWMKRSRIVNINTREKLGFVDFLGLGHYDFKNKEDYDNRRTEIFKIKEKELKEKYLQNMDKICENCGYKKEKEE